ncbi:MAG: hypothetical protein ACRDD1_21335 [Planctomycetia bacterium]
MLEETNTEVAAAIAAPLTLHLHFARAQTADEAALRDRYTALDFAVRSFGADPGFYGDRSADDEELPEREILNRAKLFEAYLLDGRAGADALRDGDGDGDD